MGNDSGHSLFVAGGRLVLIIQQVGLPVGDEAPVFHGTSTKVRNSYLIWIKRESTEVTCCYLFYCTTILLILVQLHLYNIQYCHENKMESHHQSHHSVLLKFNRSCCKVSLNNLSLSSLHYALTYFLTYSCLCFAQTKRPVLLELISHLFSVDSPLALFLYSRILFPFNFPFSLNAHILLSCQRIYSSM